MKGLILTYVILALGTIGALKRPMVGLLVYVGFAVLRPQFLWGWAGDLDGISVIIGVAMLLGWMWSGFGTWTFGRGRSIVLAFFAFFLWSCLSALLAKNTDVAWTEVVSLLKILLPFLVGVTMCNSEKESLQVLWVIVLCQAYVCLEMNISYLQGYNRAAWEGFGGMDGPSYGISLVSTIGPAIALALSARSRIMMALAAAAAALILHTTLLTFSRGAILGLIAVGAAAIVIMPKRPKYLAAIAVVTLLAIRLTGPQLTARFATTFAGDEDRDASAASRLQLWQDSLEVVRRYPAFGVGPQNFPLVSAEFGWPEGKQAHSVWMQEAAEIGIPGVLALLSFYVLTIVRLWPVVRTKVGDANRNHIAIATAVVLSVFGYMVSAQFVSLEGLEIPFYSAMVGVAFLKLQPARAPALRAPSHASPPATKLVSRLAPHDMVPPPAMRAAKPNVR